MSSVEIQQIASRKSNRRPIWYEQQIYRTNFFTGYEYEISDYLFAYRMEIAANLIQTTDESIQQIAERVDIRKCPISTRILKATQYFFPAI